MDSQSLEERVAIGKQVREVFELFDHFTDEHWVRLRDELLTRHPLPVMSHSREMDYPQAIAYGHTFMNFGSGIKAAEEAANLDR